MLLARMKRPRGASLPFGLRAGLPGLGLLAAVALAAPGAQAADDCPNAEFRTGASAYLGECRAYEKVSPDDKNNGGLGDLSRLAEVRAAADGEAAMYEATGAFAGADAFDASNSYYAHRGSSTWNTGWIGWRPFVYPDQLSPSLPGPAVAQGASQDASRTLLRLDRDPATGEQIPMTVFLVDSSAGTVERVTPDPISASGSFGDRYGIGGDLDFKNVYISSNWIYNQEAQDAGGNGNRLYHYSSRTGELSLASRTPGGDPGFGLLVSTMPIDAPLKNYVSTDGQVFFFFTASSGVDRAIYRGELGEEASVNIMASEGLSPAVTGVGKFQGASVSGDRVFFISRNRLLPEAVPAPSSYDLYMYDHSAPAGSRLTLVSEDANGNAAGGNAIRSLGNSDDGSVVYFTTQNQLLAGEDETSGNKLYRWSDADVPGGELEFLGRITSSGNIDSNSLVSSDGRFAVFSSPMSINGAATGGFSQAYLYDHETGEFACVSCRVNGTASSSAVRLGMPRSGDVLLPSKLDPIRFLLDDGRVLFTTADPVLGRDTNGVEDAYSYKDGVVSLISTGRDSSPSWFADASEDGSSIFFVTRERIVASDLDSLSDLYVARINGGISGQGGQAETTCVADACQGSAPGAPAVPSTASETAKNRGNISPTAPLRIGTRAARVSSRGFTRVTVRTPGAGRIVVRGRAIRNVRTAAGGAGAKTIRVALTRRAKRVLIRRGALRVRAQVVFRSREGGTAVRRIPLTFRTPGGNR